MAEQKYDLVYIDKSGAIVGKGKSKPKSPKEIATKYVGLKVGEIKDKYGKVLSASELYKKQQEEVRNLVQQGKRLPEGWKRVKAEGIQSLFEKYNYVKEGMESVVAEGEKASDLSEIRKKAEKNKKKQLIAKYNKMGHADPKVKINADDKRAIKKAGEDAVKQYSAKQKTKTTTTVKKTTPTKTTTVKKTVTKPVKKIDRNKMQNKALTTQAEVNKEIPKNMQRIKIPAPMNLFSKLIRRIKKSK